MQICKQLFFCFSTLTEPNLTHEQLDFIEKISSEVHDIKDINKTDSEGKTLLHLAVKAGDLSIVKELLKLKADSRIQDQFGFTALHTASYEDKDQIADFMLKNRQYNSLEEFSYGYTPIQIAAFKGNVNTVKAFFNNRMRNETEVNCYGSKFTPLHVAVRHGQAEVIKLLLNYKVNKNFETEDLPQPIEFALEFRQRDIFELLIANNFEIPKNINPEQLQNFLRIAGRSSILFYFIINQKLDHLKDLINNEGLSSENLFDKDINGNTALMWAVISGNPEILKTLLYYCYKNDVFQNFNEVNLNEETIFDVAKKYNRPKQITSLNNFTQATTHRVLSQFIEPEISKIIAKYVA